MSGVDVVVVGAGPAGLTVADVLARGGARVRLLEAGNRTPIPGDRDPVAASERSIHEPDHLEAGRRIGVGGTAHAWAIRPRPGAPPHLRLATPRPHHLVARPGVGDPGWPILWDDIAAHLDAAAGRFGLPSADDEPGGGDPLGLGPRFGLLLHQLGPASAIHSGLVDEAAVDVDTDARVLGLLVSEDRVRGVEVAGPAGSRHRVEADHVVLAMGGVATVRLLLLEAAARRLPDPHEQLGTGFMDHPHLTLGHVLPAAGAVASAAVYDAHLRDGRWVMAHHALGPGGAADLPDTTFTLRPQPAAAMPSHRFGLGPAVPARHRAAVAAHAARTRRDPQPPRPDPHVAGWSAGAGDGDVLEVRAVLSDRPRPTNRIELAATDSPTDGAPSARLIWAWTADDVELARRATALVGDVLEGAGVGRFIPWGELAPRASGVPRAWSGWHHLGGSAMSRSASDGVVTPDLAHHQTAGLHVLSTAVFPSSVGACNPTLTLVALAERLGHHLLAQ